MKKRLVLLLTILVMISMTGCGDSKESDAREKHKASREDVKENEGDKNKKDEAVLESFTIENVEASGQCGKNVYWEYGDNTLRYYGTGTYELGEPEDDYTVYINKSINSEDIKRLSFDEGITEIDGAMCSGLGDIEELYLASTIEIVDYSAIDLLSPWARNNIDENGLLINNNVLIKAVRPGETVVVPDNITCIAKGAFIGEKKLLR